MCRQAEGKSVTRCATLLIGAGTAVLSQRSCYVNLKHALYLIISIPQYFVSRYTPFCLVIVYSESFLISVIARQKRALPCILHCHLLLFFIIALNIHGAFIPQEHIISANDLHHRHEAHLVSVKLSARPGTS